MPEQLNGKSNEEEENRHAAASKEACEKMGEKYGWKLKRIAKNQNSELPVDCIFHGKQISFWDMWHDHQDDEEI